MWRQVGPIARALIRSVYLYIFINNFFRVWRQVGPIARALEALDASRQLFHYHPRFSVRQNAPHWTAPAPPRPGPPPHPRLTPDRWPSLRRLGLRPRPRRSQSNVRCAGPPRSGRPSG